MAYPFPMESFLSCLVVGCGYVGARLARAEAARRPVLGLVRSGPRASALQAGGTNVLRVDLDAAQPELQTAIAAAASGAAVVYLVPPPDAGTTDPRLESFLKQLGEVIPAVFIYVSTTGVYGDAGGATVDELSPLLPVTDRSRRRVAAEGAAASWCAARGVRCVSLRVPGIYGPHRLPLERLERGEPVLRPEEAGPGNRIHVDDLVACIVAAMDQPDARGTYNVTDGDHSSTTVYLQQLAQAAGLPAPATVTRAEAASRIPAGMLAYLLETRRVDNRRMREELGVRPLYPSLQAGLQASLAEMRMEEARP
ncbi:MAG: NAD-dependent epimerase/dehydratase family protein [Steroidobacteraceae bacterium]